MKNFHFLWGKKIFLSLVFSCTFLVAHVSANTVSGDPVKPDNNSAKTEVKVFSSCPVCPAATSDIKTEKAQCTICGYCKGQKWCIDCTCGDCSDAQSAIDGFLELYGCQ